MQRESKSSQLESSEPEGNSSSGNVSRDELSTELRLDGLSPEKSWVPDEAKSDEGGFKVRNL